VADVPNKLIVGCIEYIVQRDCELHNTEACAKMPPVNRHIVNNEISQFLTKLNQLRLIELSQVFRAIYLGQQFPRSDKHMLRYNLYLMKVNDSRQLFNGI